MLFLVNSMLLFVIAMIKEMTQNPMSTFEDQSNLSNGYNATRLKNRICK